MPIKTKEAAFSIDFVYEDENTEQEYNIKFHPTKELGKTISISSQELIAYEEENKTYVSLPALLLVEVVDFLKENNYLTNNIKKKLNKHQNKDNDTKNSDYAASLPVPDLYPDSKESKENTEARESPRIDFEPLSQEQPLQTLSVTKSSSETLSVPNLDRQEEDDIFGNEIEEDVEMEDVEMEDVEDNELAEIREAVKEREKLKDKPKMNTQKFKLKPDIKEDIKNKLRKSSEIDYDNIPEA